MDVRDVSRIYADKRRYSWTSMLTSGQPIFAAVALMVLAAAVVCTQRAISVVRCLFNWRLIRGFDRHC